MKKEYVKPEIAVEEMFLATMIAASSGVTDEVVPDDDIAVNERRGGSWGDFWN